MIGKCLFIILLTGMARGALSGQLVRQTFMHLKKQGCLFCFGKQVSWLPLWVWPEECVDNYAEIQYRFSSPSAFLAFSLLHSQAFSIRKLNSAVEVLEVITLKMPCSGKKIWKHGSIFCFKWIYNYIREFFASPVLNGTGGEEWQHAWEYWF